MKYINAKCAIQDTPKPSNKWKQLTESERLTLIRRVSKNFQNLNFIRANDDGYVYLVIEENISPGDRGSSLLKLESLLKQELDEGITVWHEPIGDRNSLRKLRGIELKTK